MITKIKNANLVKTSTVNVIGSSINYHIAEILKNEGFIDSLELKGNNDKRILCITLRYKGLQQHPYITNLVRVSKPGFRVYTKYSSIPKVLGGIGIAIFTPRIFFVKSLNNF